MSRQTIGDLFTLAKGRKAHDVFSESAPGLDRYIQIEDLRSDDELKYANDPKGTSVGPNDICIAWDGANAGTVGYGLTGLIGSTIARLRPADERRIFTPYVARFLQSQFGVLNQTTTGATIPHVSRDKLMGLSLLVPEYGDQQRIAAILEKADAIRKRRLEALSECEKLKAAIMDKVLANGSDVVFETIGSLLDSGVIALHKDGNHGSNYPRAEEFVEDLDHGVPFITAKSLRANGTIGRGQITYLGKEKASQLTIGWLKRGDVLLAHNATVGPVGVFRGEWDSALIGTSLTCFRPNPQETSTEALYAALCDPYFQMQLRKQMKQTTRNQVPITAQRALKVRLPGGQAVAQLATKLMSVQEIYSKGEAFLNDAGLIYSSLCQKAFSGKL